MRHEKIFKRDDGTRVRIIVEMYEARFNDCFKWNTKVLICKPMKRTWIGTFSNDNWDYRKLAIAEREKYENEQNLKFVSKEEILQTKIELWESIKPNY